MLQHQVYLITIAQVAAAFVGFSMIVSAITPESRITGLRQSLLYDVAQIGFIVTGGALAPYAISNFSVESEWVWRISSLGLLVTWIFAAGLAHRRNYGIGGSEGLELVMGKPLIVINIGVVVVGNGLLLWNVAAPGKHSSGMYLIALLLLLLIATYKFLRSGFDLSAAKEADRNANPPDKRL